MYNVINWISRVRSFMSELVDKRLVGTLEIDRFNIEPPLTVSEFEALGSSLGRTIPLVLRTFLTEGSRNCDCRYVFTPSNEAAPNLRAIFPFQTYIYGGASLCNAHMIAIDAESIGEWASESVQGLQAHSQWENALPFATIANGDYLAVDTSELLDDPPVLYLSHDDDSSVLASSFTSFLQTWEDLCYIGPEIWLLEGFRDATGTIIADSPKAKHLRDLLGAPKA